MAKDDYFTIVYQVLKYLYNLLKQGEKVDKTILTAEYFSIEPQYWNYIIKHLIEDGYIEGIRKVSVDSAIVFTSVDKTVITPKGIEYLTENSMMHKAVEVLKTAKSIIPGV